MAGESAIGGTEDVPRDAGAGDDADGIGKRGHDAVSLGARRGSSEGKGAGETLCGGSPEHVVV